jgi:hypothetical protein
MPIWNPSLNSSPGKERLLKIYVFHFALTSVIPCYNVHCTNKCRINFQGMNIFLHCIQAYSKATAHSLGVSPILIVYKANIIQCLTGRVDRIFMLAIQTNEIRKLHVHIKGKKIQTAIKLQQRFLCYYMNIVHIYFPLFMITIKIMLYACIPHQFRNIIFIFYKLGTYNKATHYHSKDDYTVYYTIVNIHILH